MAYTDSSDVSSSEDKLRISLPNSFTEYHVAFAAEIPCANLTNASLLPEKLMNTIGESAESVGRCDDSVDPTHDKLLVRMVGHVPSPQRVVCLSCDDDGNMVRRVNVVWIHEDHDMMHAS